MSEGRNLSTKLTIAATILSAIVGVVTDTATARLRGIELTYRRGI